jgi:outer membrane protein
MMSSVSRRRLRMLALAALLAAPAWAAPESAGERFDLPPDQAIPWLLEHNRDYRRQLADRETARQEVRRSSGEALPNLEGKLGYTRIGNISEFAFDPDGNGPEPSAVLKTTAEDSYSGSLHLSQPLFNGAVFAAIGVARSYSAVAEHGLDASRHALVRSFLDQYAQVLLLRDLVELNEQIVEQTRVHHEEAKLLAGIGSLSRYDLLRSEVEHLNSIPALREAEKNRTAAENALRITLGLEPGTELVPREFLLDVEAYNDPARLEELAISQRAEVAAAFSAVEGYSRGVWVYRADQWPVLSAFANAERSNVWDLFSQDDSWQTGWNAGVSLSVPLFSGFRKDAQVQKGKQDLRKAQAELDLVRDRVRLEARAAWDELERSRADLAAWQRNVEAAEEGLRIATTRNESGGGSGLELRDALTARKLAGVNLANAEYNLRVAQVELLHAVGALDSIRFANNGGNR